MTNIYARRAMLLLFFAFAQFATGQQLVHYWNFNNNSSVTALTTPTLSLVPGAGIVHVTGGISAIDAAGGTGQNFDVQNLNARNGDPAGTHLRFNDPIGGQLEFSIPTTGYQNPIVKFATRRSGSGAGNQLWQYSLNGTTFVSFSIIAPNNGDPALETLDFSAIAGADNNPNFKIRVSFAAGDGGTAGNNRFDNFTVDATQIGGDVNPPVATIAPTNGSTNIAVDISPTISFNENIRLVEGNATIDNTNVDAIVELRVNDASGAVVPFDATISGNIITINPISDLNNNQTYYIALMQNAVEDFNDNALTLPTSATFTTIAAQTALQAGDIAFVGYRMSATGAEDEIAFVTLVSIGGGTVINFTDAKYTTNAQPQCPGGISWTAPANTCVPAGTVVNVQTNTLVTSLGTSTGTGFGLSAGGDQVIAYTGTAAAPNYLTALTSNGWVGTNTVCTGSSSMIPAGLTSGVSALNASTAPGNTAGNAINAYYSGTQTGTTTQLRAAIMNPANWTASAGGTDPQTWPAWNFPMAVQVSSVLVPNDTTISIAFNGPVNTTSATTLSNYTGIDGLTSATVEGNTVTLTFSQAFGDQNYSLIIGSITGANGLPSGCDYTFNFDGSLATPDFNTANSFRIYPNPSRGIVQLSFAADIIVYDMTGKKVHSALNTETIDTASFAPGMYFVRTSTGLTQKLIVR